MKLSRDKTQIIYNKFLTIDGVPPQAFDYRLGTRSALEWVIDQYRLKTDKRSGILNDPNRADDPQYIVKLIGKIITVSLETVEIVENLPSPKVVEKPRPACRNNIIFAFLRVSLPTSPIETQYESIVEVPSF